MLYEWKCSEPMCPSQKETSSHEPLMYCHRHAYGPVLMGYRAIPVEPEPAGLKMGGALFVDLRDGAQWDEYSVRNVFGEDRRYFALILDPADPRHASGVWVPPTGHPWWSGAEVVMGDGCPHLAGGQNPDDGGPWRRVPSNTIAKFHALRDSDNPPPWAGGKKQEWYLQLEATLDRPSRREEVYMEAEAVRYTAKPQPQRLLDLRNGSTCPADHYSEESPKRQRYLVPIHPAPTEADCVAGSVWLYRIAERGGEGAGWRVYVKRGDEAAGIPAVGHIVDSGFNYWHNREMRLVLLPRAELLAKLEAVEKERQGKPTTSAPDNDEANRKLKLPLESALPKEYGPRLKLLREMLEVGVLPRAEFDKLRHRADMERNAKELSIPYAPTKDLACRILARMAVQRSAVAKLPAMPYGILIRCDNGADD